MARRQVGRPLVEADVPQTGNVVSDHFETYTDDTGRALWKTAVLQVLFPIIVASVVGGTETKLRGTAELIAGVSVLSGLLFALVIYVFQLGIEVSKSSKALPRRLPKLVDELFRNVLYAVASSVALLVMLIVARQFELGTGAGSGLPVVWSVAVSMFGAHLLAVVGQCVKRTRRAYITLRPRLVRSSTSRGNDVATDQ